MWLYAEPRHATARRGRWPRRPHAAVPAVYRELTRSWVGHRDGRAPAVPGCSGRGSPRSAMSAGGVRLGHRTLGWGVGRHGSPAARQGVL